VELPLWVINDNTDEESEENTVMDEFYRYIDSMKADIEEIERVAKRLGEINEESFLTVSEMREKDLATEARQLVNSTNIRAKKTKDLLFQLKSENHDKIVNASDMRIRENLCNTFTRKFIDEMKLYQSAQQKYKADMKKKAERQILNVKGDATPEEIEQIMQSEGGSHQFFQQMILSGGVNDQIKQTYTHVATKYQDTLALEQSIAELQQMLLDLCLLTEQQGELIDQIEHNVKKTAENVDTGNDQLLDAIYNQRRARKKSCWIIVIVIILTLILLLSLRIIP